MTKLNEYAILYVDDEAMSLKYFEKQFSNDFHVRITSNATDAWEIIQKEQSKIGVLMSDQRMPGQTGVQLLEKVRNHFPQIIRILVTAYSDIDSAVAGINAGGIYKYINKPWDVTDLKFTLLRALEYYGVLKERDHLLREKLSVVQRIVLCDRAKNLAVLAAGLSSQFRHTLSAADAFVAAIPQPAVQQAVEESLRRETAKNLEHDLQRAGENLHYIANGLKALAEDSSSSSAALLSLNALLSPITKSPASGSASSVLLKVSASLPKIKASQKQLTKLFGLLITNLLAVSGGSSTLTIEAESIADPKGAPSVKIQLGDEGTDWTPEQRVRFFAPFASFKHDGDKAGLDLAICFFIVHHHHGRISVPGQSKARVVVELPVDPFAGSPDVLDGGQLAEMFRQNLGFA